MSGGGGLLTLGQLLAAGAFLLVVLGASSWFLLRQDKELKQLGARIDLVATPYARAAPLGEKTRRDNGPKEAGKVASWLSRLFGYNPRRKDQYPAKWPVLVGFALVVALVVRQVAGSFVGPLAWLGLPVAWVFLSRKAFGYFEQRRAGVLYVQFPDALAMIVRSVRVGIPVTEAVRNVAHEAMEPTATEFGLLADQLAIGVQLEDALRDVAGRNQLPEYRFFATALTLQAQTGGGLSETLENLADVIRKRVAARKRAYALASEARTTTYVLAGLPVLTSGALAVLNPSYVSVLFTDPTGNMILGVAVGMLVTGIFVMRKTISATLQ